MVENKNIIIAVIVLAAVAILYFLLHKSEEDKVKLQLELLGKHVSMETGEKPVTAVTKAKNTRDLFAEISRLEIPAYSLDGSFTHGDISSLLISSRSYFSRFTLEFKDINVEITEEDKAEAEVTVRLSGKLTSGERTDETHELECKFKKIEGEWLFSGITAVAVLQK